jgi:hypothetical protein
VVDVLRNQALEVVLQWPVARIGRGGHQQEGRIPHKVRALGSRVLIPQPAAVEGLQGVEARGVVPCHARRARRAQVVQCPDDAQRAEIQRCQGSAAGFGILWMDGPEVLAGKPAFGVGDDLLNDRPDPGLVPVGALQGFMASRILDHQAHKITAKRRGAAPGFGLVGTP